MPTQESNRNIPVRRRDDLSPSVYRPLRGLQTSISRLFDDFFDLDFMPSLASNLDLNAAFAPAAEITETDNQYCLCMDVPGIPKKNDQKSNEEEKRRKSFHHPSR